ncbi:translation elongation factor 4 [Candidatus Gromoviella agglomerans]|uniref:translation elongation factor 4 n=1 Tax=Candidatus Gromoviella agglomerans TaxID=2806609 RepID=UPI001E65011C|nr:translation elongation factor 4 [Candidatus Gromoviella agglomerans]UFX98489.1 Elongation factor 4 [Candidatus Gromoviella agglomerans]
MLNKIRNFAIIAHIDHGKSTLADRLIEFSNAVTQREMRDQILDSMDIERRRGITIKAQTVRLRYVDKNGVDYQLNLLDTPGHVDFGYEVSRSLAACEGSLLVVDASQGVEAQTLANVYKAIDVNHEIIVVLNKIDLPAADVDATKRSIEDVIGISAEGALEISAKSGIGIQSVFEAILTLPPPAGVIDGQLRALLIDSWYDPYMGVVTLVRVKDGCIKKGMKIKMLSNGASYVVENVGVFLPQKSYTSHLNTGEIGFIIANIRHIEDCAVGDTITEDNKNIVEALPGFSPVSAVVYCSLYPEDTLDFNKLKDSLEKLRLNDSSFTFEMETSAALGMGFRCGFLGLLHLEVIQERLEEEFDLNIISTAPSVSYKVFLVSGDVIDIHNAADMPESTRIQKIQELWMKVKIICPSDYIGSIIQICEEREGIQEQINYVNNRVMVDYRMPLSEIIFDFYDKLKSITSGYASFDCVQDEYVDAKIVKVDILINGEPVDALSFMAPKNKAQYISRTICQKLKNVIKRQMFNIIIQAAIGGKIIAREDVRAFRKDVIGEKCTGKDRKQKRKEAQKRGKDRMQRFGRVELPKSAFLTLLSR